MKMEDSCKKGVRINPVGTLLFLSEMGKKVTMKVFLTQRTSLSVQRNLLKCNKISTYTI